MMLIEHEARVGLPRMWEHPTRTHTRRGGVVASMVGGYTAILLVRQPNGVENSIRRQCSTLNEAEKMAGRTDRRRRMSDHRTPDAPGLWKAAHGGYGVMFHDDGEPAMLLFGPGAKVRALDAIGPYTRLQPGVPVGSAPVPNLPGLWMDKDGSLYFLSDGRRVWRIRDNREWMGEEIEDNSEELSTQCPYTRYSIQAAEEVPWKPASDDSTPIHEGSRTVHLPDVRSFGRLEQDKWLAVKNLEESAELVEACKQWLKACDPADPSGIDGQFIGVVNCLNIHGAAVGDEPDIDLDKAQADWHDHVRDQRRQAMLDELADVLQTVGNLITAFGITDEEVERAMSDCLERNRRKGRL